MMKPTTLNVTMMVETVVDLVSIETTAQNANVLEESLAMTFQMQRLEMDIVRMKPTVQTACMMV